MTNKQALLDISPMLKAVYSTLKKDLVFISLFSAIFIAIGSDLLDDMSYGLMPSHIIKESMVVVASMSAIIWLLFDLQRQRFEIIELKQEIQSHSKHQELPKKYVLEGRETLTNVISQQFSDWTLTDSEAEVGWLLLKGFSLKEISTLRNTKEKTVRQQASSIYKKAGIGGRHAFSAWFIEDIL